jgi:hypothetical protein
VAYPYRLEAALRAKYQGRMIDVLNRGIGGDEAPGELRRLAADVVDEKPSLVVWQVGTNAAWKNCDLNSVGSAIREGLELLIGKGMDVVLMDLQYAPAVLTAEKIDAALRMVSLIAEAADAASQPVNVFRRFDMMRRWHEIEGISFDRMIDPCDPHRLHHSEWSAQRMAQALCDAIAAGIAAAGQPS